MKRLLITFCAVAVMIVAGTEYGHAAIVNLSGGLGGTSTKFFVDNDPAGGDNPAMTDTWSIAGRLGFTPDIFSNRTMDLPPYARNVLQTQTLGTRNSGDGWGGWSDGELENRVCVIIELYVETRREGGRYQQHHNLPRAGNSWSAWPWRFEPYPHRVHSVISPLIKDQARRFFGGIHQ